MSTGVAGFEEPATWHPSRMGGMDALKLADAPSVRSRTSIEQAKSVRSSHMLRAGRWHLGKTGPIIRYDALWRNR